MFSDPTFFVALAFACFIILVAKPIGKIAAKALDSRAEQIKSELDEAEKLRNEAQDLLAQYQRKQRDASKEAAAIIAHAKEEAERLDREGRERLAASLERREKLAVERINLAEQQAIAQVRAHAVEIAVDAARAVLASSISANKANDLIDDAINQLPDRLH